MKLTIKHCWKIIAALISVLLLCSSCYYDDFSEEHAPFDIAFSKVKEEFPDLELTEKDWAGYGWYYVRYYPPQNEVDHCESITEILYEFDRVINSSSEFSTLLNACYIRVESVTGEWVAITYHYDRGTEIATNYDKEQVPTIKEYFSDEKIIVRKMIDGKPAQIEY